MAKTTYIESAKIDKPRAKVPPELEESDLVTKTRILIAHLDQEIDYWQNMWKELADAIEGE